MFKAIRIVVFILAWIPLTVFAADRLVSEADFSAYKELAQTKLDAAKESLQKDREKVEARFDAQDKRIGDLNFTLTAFGGFLTVLVLVAGGVGWVSVRNRTREETRETAEKWFREKAGELEREMERLRECVKESHSEIESLRKKFEQHVQSVTQDVNAWRTQVQESNKGNSSQSDKSPDGISATAGKDGEALEKMEQAIRSKPETEYNFDDWNMRAFSAWHKNDLEGAARYWKAAAQVEDAADEQIAQSLFNAGAALGQLSRSEDAIAVYDAVAKRFGDAPEVALRELVAKALLNKGVAFGQLNRYEDEIAECDAVVKRYGNAPEAALREQVAGALFNKGVALGQMNRSEDAIALYDAVVKRFGDASEAALREQVAKVLFNKGAALGQMNRCEGAIAVYDELVKRFGDAPEAALREQVAKALVNKGVVLGQMNRSEDAIAVYDEVVKRYGDAPEAALREQVAWALVNKGVMLDQMSCIDDEIAVYDEVVKRFGDAPEAALQKQVAKALTGKGLVLLYRAKQCWADGTTRRADLQTAESLFEQAVANIENKPVVWDNQAYTAFLLGQYEAVRPLLRQALQQGGEKLYKDTLGGLDIHPVPPDEEFRAMLEELWAEVQHKA